jgi:hypothetical protein
MWEWNYIYGAILLRDYEKSIKVIKSLGQDKSFPFINTNMFSIGAQDIPYYYDDRIITFGATYKYFGYEMSEWKIFILKIEHLLRKMSFQSAQFHASGAIDEVTLFWYDIKEKIGDINEEYFSKQYDLIKTDEWYFGYGSRNLHHPVLDSDECSKLDIEYPVKYEKDIIREFRDRI